MATMKAPTRIGTAPRHMRDRDAAARGSAFPLCCKLSAVLVHWENSQVAAQWRAGHEERGSTDLQRGSGGLQLCVQAHNRLRCRPLDDACQRLQMFPAALLIVSPWNE